jgi:NAD(P)-dependent dehydrogenase (short-subunit alcohol dehydrogenase family)
MDLDLKGKVALVTAASQGIGLAVAQRLAVEGATVAINARHPEAAAAASRGSLKAYAADLDDPHAAADMIGRVIADLGRLDILVLNTGGPRIVSFLEAKLDDWSLAYRRLVQPCVVLAQAGARQMVRQGGEGAVVFITSTWVSQPKPGGVLSATMRSAVSALSKQMALELAPHGIRVNQVQPGATGTDRMHAIVAARAAQNGTTADAEISCIVGDIPLGRWGEADEIADVVAFIVSPRAGFVTGTTLQVDGGSVRATI